MEEKSAHGEEIASRKRAEAKSLFFNSEGTKRYSTILVRTYWGKKVYFCINIVVVSTVLDKTKYNQLQKFSLD